MRRFIRRTLRRLGFNVSKFGSLQERFDDTDQFMAWYREQEAKKTV